MHSLSDCAMSFTLVGGARSVLQSGAAPRFHFFSPGAGVRTTHVEDQSAAWWR